MDWLTQNRPCYQPLHYYFLYRYSFFKAPSRQESFDHASSNSIIADTSNQNEEETSSIGYLGFFGWPSRKCFQVSWTRAFSFCCGNLPAILQDLRNGVRQCKWHYKNASPSNNNKNEKRCGIDIKVAVRKSQRVSMERIHLSQCRQEWAFGGVSVGSS